MLMVNSRVHLSFGIIVRDLIDLHLNLVTEYFGNLFKSKTLCLRFVNRSLNGIKIA